MKKKKILQFLLPAMLCAATALTLTGCGTKQQTGVAAMETETATDMETATETETAAETETATDTEAATDTETVTGRALPVKALSAKRIDENPYMAKSDANIHHDGYNTAWYLSGD